MKLLSQKQYLFTAGRVFGSQNQNIYKSIREMFYQKYDICIILELCFNNWQDGSLIEGHIKIREDIGSNPPTAE